MSNLPEQAHQHGTAVAVAVSDPYAIDQSMVKLPSLYLAQYSSKAFKARRVGFGSIYVGIGAEDTSPVVVGESDGESLSKPVRFYIHSAGPGFQIVDDDAPYGKRSLRPGTTFQQALMEVGGDPRLVFQQTFYVLTVPGYPLLPVRFIAGSRWGGNAGRWINTQIAIAKDQGKNPLALAFQIQTKPDQNDSGEFVTAIVGFADVKAKDAASDKELVARHAAVLATTNVVMDDDYEAAAQPANAPSLS